MLRDKLIGGTSDKALKYVAVASNTSPFVEVYSFGPSGFGSKFANPASLPSASVGSNATTKGLVFSPKGDYLIVGIANTTDPRYALYPFSSSGFGTRIATQSLGVADRAYAWRPDQSGIALTLRSGALMSMRSFTTDIGAAYTSQPAPLNGSQDGRSVAVHPANNAVAATWATSPYVGAAVLTSNGYGAAYSAPATGVGATSWPWDVEFSPSGNSIVITTDASPWVAGYAWTSGSGFGSKFSNPSSALSRSPLALSFHPNGNYVAFSQGLNGIYVYAYNDSTGFGSLAVTASPGGFVYDVQFSRDGKYLAVTHDGSPYISMYNWTGSAVGSKLSNPASLPAGECYSVALF